ncbi:MAG: hypothetical protein JST82_09180 [Bacteroidetes bacterium]|nr:hypothetical protein [Bacteroidota bacterium]
MKLFFAISLAFTSLSCIASTVDTGQVITTPNGDVIVMSKPKTKLAKVITPEICKEETVTIDKPRPVLLNGKEIYFYKDHPNDEITDIKSIELWTTEYKKFQDLLKVAIKAEMKLLPEGFYECRINNMVVSEAGKIVYFETNGISRLKPGKSMHRNEGYLDIPLEIRNTADEKLTNAIGDMHYTPFIFHEKATPYLGSYTFSFEVGNPEGYFNVR